MRSKPGSGVSRLLLALLLAAPAAWPQEEEPSKSEAVAGEAVAPAAPEAPEPPPRAPDADDGVAWEITGYLRSELRYRSVASENDLDFYLDFYADAARGGDRPLRARVNGRLIADLAGNQQPGDLLRSFWDGYDSDVQVRMYEAYVDAGGLLEGGILSARGGRQFVDEGIWLHLDGIRFDVELQGDLEGLRLTPFFGVPVRFGEQSRNDAWLAGLVANYRVDEKTRARFEYYHVEEFFEGINDPVIDPILTPVSIPAGDIDDDLFGLSLWHNPNRSWRIFGRVTILNGDANELQVRVRWISEDGLWSAVADYFHLFGRLDNVTNDLSPYVPLLGAYQPFFRLGARVTRRHGDFWIFQVGGSHRELEDEDDEGTFNHEYNHYYASVTRSDLADGRLDATASLNGYYSSRNDAVAVVTNLDYRIDSEWMVSGGVDYSLFKYDWFSNTEREDIWTFFARLRWKQSQRVTADFELSFEDDRFEEYFTFSIEVKVRF